MSKIVVDYGNSASGGINGYELISRSPTNSASQSTQTLTDLTVGKKYLLLMFALSAGSLAIDRFDGATASGGTLTKVTTALPSAGQIAGTYYTLVPTATSVTITATNAWCYLLLDTN